VQLHLPTSRPPVPSSPLPNLENYYLQFILIFNIVLGGKGGGGAVTRLQKPEAAIVFELQ